VELYGRVRRAVRVEGKSERAVALEFGLARETVRKMLRYAVPPGYRRQQSPKRPKLGPWLGVIDAILEDDKQQPKKQRHTAKRIFERLRSEHAYTGGYTIVKDYVRQYTLRHQEMFVPLTHAPGQAQADFGEALVVVGGVEQKAHYLAMDLPHSDDCFVMAFSAETTEAFLEGHVQAFAYFGGVPTCILYDNTKLAVAKILVCGGCWKHGCTRAASASIYKCCVYCRRSPCQRSKWPLSMRCIWARSVSMRSSICCCAASTIGRRGWTWRTIRICPSLRCRLHKPPTTWRCSRLRPSRPRRLPLPR